MLPTRLGYAVRMKDVFTMINSGVVPVILYKDFIYCIDSTGQPRGMLYYTKFTKNGVEALHSVIMPFSYAHTLGEVLDRGEGLQDKLPPIITLLPPLAYTILN